MNTYLELELKFWLTFSQLEFQLFLFLVHKSLRSNVADFQVIPQTLLKGVFHDVPRYVHQGVAV